LNTASVLLLNDKRNLESCAIIFFIVFYFLPFGRHRREKDMLGCVSCVVCRVSHFDDVVDSRNFRAFW